MQRPYFADLSAQSSCFKLKVLLTQETERPSIVDRPRGTGDYLFILFYDEVDIRINGKTQHVPGKHLVIWGPQDGHWYGNSTRSWKHTWFHCSGSLVGKTLRANHIAVRSPIPLREPFIVDKYVIDMYNELAGHVTPDPVIVGNLFHNFLREVARASRGEDNGRTIPQKYLDLKKFLDAHYYEPMTLALLSRRCNLSEPYLCMQFKNYFGISIIEHVIRMRMQNAALLLRNHNLNITEIGRQVGYEDIFYFSRLFKKRFDMSPMTMRRRASC